MRRLSQMKFKTLIRGIIIIAIGFASLLIIDNVLPRVKIAIAAGMKEYKCNNPLIEVSVREGVYDEGIGGRLIEIVIIRKDGGFIDPACFRHANGVGLVFIRR